MTTARLLHFYEIPLAGGWVQRVVDSAGPTGERGVRWRDQGWLTWPVSIDNITAAVDGQQPTLTLGWLPAFETLKVGATVVRWRTNLSTIDARNWGDPGTNPVGTPDPDAHRRRETWQVVRRLDRVASGTIRWQLASVLDQRGRQLPSRQLSSTRCPYVYRGPECGYAGQSKWTYDGQPSATVDRCARTLAACRLRFPLGTIPWGGVVTDERRD